jgi:Protein of unknown function (DUF3592)
MEFEVRPIQDSQQKWAEARPILRCMGFMLLAVGSFLLLNSVYAGAQKYRRLGKWVPADAVVLESKLVNEPSGRVTDNYRASFTLQYHVRGRTLVSSAQNDHTGAYASEVSDWIYYQPGSRQRIRYNPAQPAEITIDGLNARSFREPLKLFGWGAGLILIGFLLKR